MQLFGTYDYAEVQENNKNCVFTWINTPQVILLRPAFPKDLLHESDLNQVKNAHKMVTGYKFHKEEYIFCFLCSKYPSHLSEGLWLFWFQLNSKAFLYVSKLSSVVLEFY